MRICKSRRVLVKFLAFVHHLLNVVATFNSQSFRDALIEPNGAQIYQTDQQKGVNSELLLDGEGELRYYEGAGANSAGEEKAD